MQEVQESWDWTLLPKSHSQADDAADWTFCPLSDHGPCMQLWAAVREVRESGDWALLHVPRDQALDHEAHLAKGTAHELPPLDVPAWPALVPTDASKPEVCRS